MTTTATATEFHLTGTWNSWGDAFLSAKTVPMTSDQSRILISLVMMEQSNTSMPKEITEGFEYKVGLKRKEALGLDINPYALVMLCTIANSVGEVVMYITALTRRYHLTGKAIDTLELAKAFPIGFLTANEMKRLWDAQKGFNLGEKFDNLIDQVSKDDF